MIIFVTTKRNNKFKIMKKPKINGLEKLTIKQLENLIEYIEEYKQQKEWLELAKRVGKELNK